MASDIVEAALGTDPRLLGTRIQRVQTVLLVARARQHAARIGRVDFRLALDAKVLRFCSFLGNVPT